MPRSGPDQSLTLTGHSSVLPKITWGQFIYVWVKISLTMISLYLIVLSLPVVVQFG